VGCVLRVVCVTCGVCYVCELCGMWYVCCVVMCVLEFKASTFCLEQDNPIMPQVTAVHTEGEEQLTS